MPESTQFCIGLENKPGVLAKLCAAICQAQIKVEALFVSDDEDFCWVNMVSSPVEATRHMLAEGGYNFFTEKVLVVRVDGAEALEAIASNLAEGGVNINNIYGSCAEGAASTLVMNVSDLPKALTIVKS